MAAASAAASSGERAQDVERQARRGLLADARQLAQLLDEARDGRREHPISPEQPGGQRHAARGAGQLGLGQLAGARRARC